LQQRFPRRRFLTAGTWLAALLVSAPVSADRHCSFARESAFYAREFSAEAAKLPAGRCDSKVTEALERLDDARIELEICSCTAAEAPLARWLEDRKTGDGNRDRACRVRAAAINAISKTVLKQVETCF